MIKIRSKNINDRTIDLIISVIDGWKGKLTWDKLIKVIEGRSNIKYTRQALFKHTRIKLAFQNCKSRSVNFTVNPTETKENNPAILLLKNRIDRLEAENSRLQLENERLLEQFVRWAYNAHLRGLDKVFLDNSLPSVDRQPTKKGRK